MEGEQKIVMNFSPGKTTIKVVGVKGSACKSLSQAYEKILLPGATKTTDKPTVEMTQLPTTASQTAQIRQH